MAFFKGKRSTGRDNSGKKGGKRRTLGNSHKGARAEIKRFSGARTGGRPEMHSTRCSGCGNTCEVPFRPSGAKPVFCSACFRGTDSNSKPTYNQSTPRVTEDYTKQFNEIHQKLNVILEILNTTPDALEVWDAAKGAHEPKEVVEEPLQRGALKKAILKKAVKKKKAEKKKAAKKKK
ncbi:MAG: CxxC-x17-CxxC domain-containing protein [Candidatus Paceibacterota bacterium]